MKKVMFFLNFMLISCTSPSDVAYLDTPPENYNHEKYFYCKKLCKDKYMEFVKCDSKEDQFKCIEGTEEVGDKCYKDCMSSKKQ